MLFIYRDYRTLQNCFDKHNCSPKAWWIREFQEGSIPPWLLKVHQVLGAGFLKRWVTCPLWEGSILCRIARHTLSEIWRRFQIFVGMGRAKGLGLWNPVRTKNCRNRGGSVQISSFGVFLRTNDESPLTLGLKEDYISCLVEAPKPIIVKTEKYWTAQF